jgi:NAD(P)-dependent dehydrogenase (short-subunit alcohol dehydrogenase family)
MAAPHIIVVGAGPGVGAAVARRFGTEGYAVGLVGRSAPSVAELGEALRGEGITAGWALADVSDDAALRAAVERLATAAGRLDVLHYNPSVTTMKDPLSLTPDELVADVRVGVGGLLTAVQAARPFMSEGGRVVATGSRAADVPWAGAASLGVQKAGLRSLMTAVDAVLAPHGIRAVSVTVNGVLAPGGPFDPARVAEALYAAATQPVEEWRTEVPFNGAS